MSSKSPIEEMKEVWPIINGQIRNAISTFAGVDFSEEMRIFLMQKIRFVLIKHKKKLGRILKIKSINEIPIEVENDFANHWLVRVGLNDLRDRVFSQSRSSRTKG